MCLCLFETKSKNIALFIFSGCLLLLLCQYFFWIASFICIYLPPFYCSLFFPTNFMPFFLSWWCRLESRASVLDLRVECQDLERFSVINRFAKFHGRGQNDGAETSSSSDATANAQKPTPQKYVTAMATPRNLPDRVQCLSLWSLINSFFHLSWSVVSSTTCF